MNEKKNKEWETSKKPAAPIDIIFNRTRCEEEKERKSPPPQDQVVVLTDSSESPESNLTVSETVIKNKCVALVERAKSRAIKAARLAEDEDKMTEKEIEKKEKNVKALLFYDERLKSEKDCQLLVQTVNQSLPPTDELPDSPALSESFNNIVCNMCKRMK